VPSPVPCLGASPHVPHAPVPRHPDPQRTTQARSSVSTAGIRAVVPPRGRHLPVTIPQRFGCFNHRLEVGRVPGAPRPQIAAGLCDPVDLRRLSRTGRRQPGPLVPFV